MVDIMTDLNECFLDIENPSKVKEIVNGKNTSA